MVPDLDRHEALKRALDLHIQIGNLGLKAGVAAAVTITADETAIRDTAETFLAWLRGVHHLRLTRGPLTQQATGIPVAYLSQGATAVQIHDNEQYDYTLAELDSKGFPTSAPTAWASSDETVVPVSVDPADDNIFHVVAAAPGTATITATSTRTDGTTLSVSDLVEVVPGDVATMSVTAGPVSVQA